MYNVETFFHMESHKNGWRAISCVAGKGACLKLAQFQHPGPGKIDWESAIYDNWPQHAEIAIFWRDWSVSGKLWAIIVFLIITGDGFCTYIVLKLSNNSFEISGIEKDTFTNILRKSKYALPTRFLLSESRSGNVDTFDEIFSDLSDSSSTDSTCFIHVLHLPVNVIRFFRSYII